MLEVSFLGFESGIYKTALSGERFKNPDFCLLSKKDPNIITISTSPWKCSGFTARKKDNTESKHLRSFHFVVSLRYIESPKLESNELELNRPLQWNT